MDRAPLTARLEAAIACLRADAQWSPLAEDVAEALAELKAQHAVIDRLRADPALTAD